MNETRNKIGTWVGFAFILVWCLLPVIWIISLSFKGPSETAAGSPQFLPEDPTLQNYDDIINNPDFRDSLINSFGISAISTVRSRRTPSPAWSSRASAWCCRLRWRSRCSLWSPWSGRCSTCGGRSGSSTPGRA
jgi:hypothetical protein